MKLPYYDYDARTTKEFEYPDEMFVDFIRYFMLTNRWMDETWLIEDKVRRLKQEMAEFRTAELQKQKQQSQQRTDAADEQKARDLAADEEAARLLGIT